MKKWLSLFLLLIAPVFADDSIVVPLQTDNQLMPLYLAPFKGQQSGFPPSYTQELEEVMRFDLDHNGATYVIKNEKDAYYTLEVSIRDRKLSATVTSLEPPMAKKVEGLQLSGQLGADRSLLHQLADTIHETLFGTPGVASTKILYTVRYPVPGKKHEWKAEVWEADYDGANARQITHNSGYVVTPVFLPKEKGKRSTHFLYVGYATGQSKIYISSLREAKPQRLSYMRGNQLMPAVSRQRNWIAFISDITTNPDLFLQPFDSKTGPVGKPQQIYHAPMKTQGTPTFSPDGRKIAFVSNKGGSPQIYILTTPPLGARLKEIKAKQLTHMNRESTAPAWSPDGSKIAYCAKSGSVRQIWIYDFAKGEEKQLTDGPENKENPAWAADSLHLIYNTAGPSHSELFLINLKQPEAVQISSGSGEKRFPSWEN